MNSHLKEKLNSGKNAIGTWVTIPSPIIADILSASLDFIVIDMEHGPISFETAQLMVIAANSRGKSSMVRISGVNQSEILKALDIGASGVHIPNVSSLEQAKLAVSYAKYPPLGSRGFSPFTRAGNYGLDEISNITSAANKNVLVAIHIEGKDAVSQIDDILKIDGIDIVFLGVYDISKSLGIAGKVDDPKVTQIVKDVTIKAKSVGKHVGIIVRNDEQFEMYKKIGINYFTYAVDCDVIANAYKQISLSDSKSSI